MGSVEGGGGDGEPGAPIMEDCPLEALRDNKLACVDTRLLPLVFHPPPPLTQRHVLNEVGILQYVHPVNVIQIASNMYPFSPHSDTYIQYIHN